ncbi:MAG TPA: hypothetical protein VHV79_04130 [Mycobacteriales bacterium]|nr:hypothetical protein [Mycobacteriales bacterium]
MSADPFQTGELRRRVLDAWRQSPARFRADANVEDDLALTGYRDRVVVELAQNAADAATRAGIAGRLILSLEGDTLTAANTGTPLDAAGVESIAVARASAKVDQLDTVGRFGVGFAAVLAVSDEPSIVSSSGAVRWSRADALAAVAALPELAPELATRGDRVPVLRLPFAADVTAEPGTDTTVVLPLRDVDAVDAVRRQLRDLESTILLALPALHEVLVRIDSDERLLRADRSGDAVVLHDGSNATRWLVVTAAGVLPTELLAERPAEEQRFDSWHISWALPVDDDGRMIELPPSVLGVVRAPTVVDDPMTLPAVLIASYPLDASRRRVTPGALADAVTAHAAELLVETIAELPPDPSTLRLVPTGFPDGEYDATLHAAVLERLAEAAWLPIAAEPDLRQRPREAVIVADPLVVVLRDVVPSLLPAGWSRPELTALGVSRPSIARLVEALPSGDRPPAWWYELYAALDQVVLPGPERDALGALPVPLRDGTIVTGPRGLALPGEGMPAVDLSVIGIRIVHPDAAHPLLAILGATDGAPAELLAQPQVQAAVEASYDDDDPEPVATAVLSLLAATGGSAEKWPWLAELALPDDSGDWRPAGELLLPGGLMASVVAVDSGFGRVSEDWAQRWGGEVLTAAGVLDRPAIIRETDAVGPGHDLDDEASWWATLPADCAVEGFVAVRDLEQVRPEALADLIPVLAEPPHRATIVEAALVTRPDGGRLLLPSYTAWWLSSRPVLAGQVPRDLRTADSDGLLAALYDVAPVGFDIEFLRALGVHASLDDADADAVLARLADGSCDVTRDQLRRLNRWLAGRDVAPPARVRAVRDGRVVVVDAADAVIVDAPDMLALLGNLAVVPVALSRAAALAESLDLPLASELADYQVVSQGEPVDDAVVHPVLQVADVDGVTCEVAWRLVEEVLHVDGRELPFGLGRGRAWRDHEWAQRHRRTEVLNDPGSGIIRDGEDDVDDDPEE